MGLNTLSAPDSTHIFVIGQDYANGTYGDWNLYESDGKTWSQVNSQTDSSIAPPQAGQHSAIFNASLSNLDFISTTEGWATSGNTLYHITIANGTATWSQVYPASTLTKSGASSAPPAHVPGAVVAAPQNPGACAGQTAQNKGVIPGNTKSNAQSHTITFVNNTSQQIWVGATGTTLNYGNWNGELDAHKSASITVKTPSGSAWSGRFWGRTGCNSSGAQCDTGDCGTAPLCGGLSGALPASLAEFAFNQHAGLIFYDVSLVDGYNLPMLIQSSEGASPDNCGSKACIDINTVCPSALQKVNASGQVVACNSACNAFGTSQYCCTGAYVSGVCNPNTWPADVNSAKLFKDAYPHAYSYAYDDATSTYTCAETCSFTIIFGRTP